MLKEKDHATSGYLCILIYYNSVIIGDRNNL